MKYISVIVALFSLSGYAKIYQTYDPQGNPSFSDKQGKGASLVTLQGKAFTSRSSAQPSLKQTKDMLEQIQVLMVEIKSLENRLAHFALNDYEEAILKIKLSKMKKKLDQLQSESHEALSKVSERENRQQAYALSVTRMHIRQLQKAIELADRKNESAAFLRSRLLEEQAALKRMESAHQ